MQLYVKKNPSPKVLAEKIYVDDGAQGPSGFVLMTEAEFTAWLATQTAPAFVESPGITEGKAQEATDAADLSAVRALIPDIKAGTGTNGERITRLEKAVVRLFRALK